MGRMTKVSEGAVSADAGIGYDYDGIAEGYSAENETSLVNAYYERPAMLNLAGDVAGRRILDAGCGSGPLFVRRAAGSRCVGDRCRRECSDAGAGPSAAGRRRGLASRRPRRSFTFPTAPSTT